MFSETAGKKKRYTGTFMTVLLTLAVPIVLVVVLLLTVPKLRHGVFLFSLELPGYATNFMLQQYVPVREFGKALPWLERELDLVNRFAPPRNRLLPGLIRNTEYVMGRARFPEELAIFRPFLEKFVDSHPNLYSARLWLARALADVDPATMYEHLKAATKLSSADDQPFRLAINLALRKRLPEKLKEWCNRYKKSHFGGLTPLDYGTEFRAGIGLRILQLEIVDESGKRHFSVNKGLRLKDNIVYDFPLAANTSIVDLNLNLGIVPGISVALNKIQFYKSGQRVFAVEKDLALISGNGFHLKDGKFLTVSSDGEIISILPPEGGFGEADRIELTLSFERLDVATPSLCGEKKAS